MHQGAKNRATYKVDNRTIPVTVSVARAVSRRGIYIYIYNASRSQE